MRVAIVALHLNTALGSIHTQLLGAIKLALGKTVLTCTLGYTNSADDAAKNVVLFAAYAHRKSIFGATQEECRSATCGTLEWWLGLLAQLSIAVVKHGADEAVYIIVAQIFLAVLLAVWGCLALLIDVTENNRLFLVFLDVDNHLLIVGHWIVNTLSSLLGHGDRRENLLDFLLHLINIYIAHNNYCLQVRAIPLLIIVAQVLIREVIYDIHRADRHTIFVLGSLINLGHSLLHESLNGHTGTTCAPLFVNNTTLLVNLSIFEQQIVAPIVQNQQTRVDNALTFQWGRAYVINGLVYRGVGVEIGTELNADGLAPRNNAQLLTLSGEVLGAVECHVLKEVGKSALTWLLKYRTYSLGNVEISKACLFCIVADIIGHAVLKLTLAYCRVLWQTLSHCRNRQQHQS